MMRSHHLIACLRHEQELRFLAQEDAKQYEEWRREAQNFEIYEDVVAAEEFEAWQPEKIHKRMVADFEEYEASREIADKEAWVHELLQRRLDELQVWQQEQRHANSSETQADSPNVATLHTPSPLKPVHHFVQHLQQLQSAAFTTPESKVASDGADFTRQRSPLCLSDQPLVVKHAQIENFRQPRICPDFDSTNGGNVGEAPTTPTTNMINVLAPISIRRSSKHKQQRRNQNQENEDIGNGIVSKQRTTKRKRR